MIAWMLYATLVGAVLGGVGLLAEHGVRRLGSPVRWVWASVMATTVGLPFVVAGIVSGSTPGAGSAAADSLADTGVLAAWGVVSLLLLTSLRLSAWTLRRNGREWRGARVAGRRVRLSSRFGPGVVGAVRPQVVLPAWLLDADEELRGLVVRHEIEHVRARDPALLTGALVLTALVPWCLPLWWQLARLREAIETDCDARVLPGADAHAYANALVSIAGRPTSPLLPVPSLRPGRYDLERRIRWITAGARRSRRTALGLLGLAVVLALGISVLPAPAELPRPLLPELSVAGAMAGIELPLEAKVFLSVEPGPGPGR